MKSGQNQVEINTLLLPEEFKDDQELFVYPKQLADIQILIKKQLTLNHDISKEFELIETSDCISLFQYGIPVGCISNGSGYLMMCRYQDVSAKFFELIKQYGDFFMFNAIELFHAKDFNK